MMDYIPRKISGSVLRAAEYYSVIVITGPRQVGKSTLCRHLFGDYNQYNMEDVALRQAIKADPKAFLDSGRQGQWVSSSVQTSPASFQPHTR